MGSNPIGVIRMYTLTGHCNRQVYMTLLGYSCKIADVAQLVELLICNQQVGGSSPLVGLPDGVTVAQGILVPFV